MVMNMKKERKERAELRPDLLVVREFVNTLLEESLKSKENNRENNPDEKENKKEVINKKEIMNKIKNKTINAVTVLEVNQLRFLSEMLRLNKELHKARVNGYVDAGFTVGRIEVKLIQDGIVGIGSGPFKAIFEVGLTIDPITGLPYYPGSGIKGAVRSFVEAHYGEDVADSLFGESDKEGHVSLAVFTDLIPIGCEDSCSIFRGLVINPHYYEGGRLVESEIKVKPVPVIHIGIPKGLIFGMAIAIRKSDKKVNEVIEYLKKNVSSSKNNDVKPLNEMLKKVLNANHISDDKKVLYVVSLLTLFTLRKGIAARSSKGYNVFEPYKCDNLDTCLKFNVVSWEVKGRCELCQEKKERKDKSTRSFNKGKGRRRRWR